jgi:hypothetical protein
VTNEPKSLRRGSTCHSHCKGNICSYIHKSNMLVFDIHRGIQRLTSASFLSKLLPNGDRRAKQRKVLQTHLFLGLSNDDFSAA